MFRCDIEELEADFSAIIAKVEAGATVTVYKDDEPFAEIRPIEQQGTFEERPVGLGRKRYPNFKLADNLKEPLPDDILAYFTGEQDEEL